MRRALGVLRLGGLLLASGLLLAGCVKLDAELTIDGSDTVTGTVVFALDRRLTSLSGQAEQVSLASLRDPENLPVGAHAEAYEDSQFVGVRIVYDHVALAEFNSRSSGQDVHFGHTDGRYTVRWLIDLSTIQLSNPGAALVAQGLSLHIAITMPGRVTEHNGQLNGRTVTWTPKPGQRVELRAVSEEPREWVPLLIGGGVVCLCLALTAAIAGVAFFLIRRRRAVSVASAEASPPWEHRPEQTRDLSNPPSW